MDERSELRLAERENTTKIRTIQQEILADPGPRSAPAPSGRAAGGPGRHRVVLINGVPGEFAGHHAQDIMLARTLITALS
jgi:hypothetical protein